MKNIEKPSSTKPGKLNKKARLAIIATTGFCLLFSFLVPAMADQEKIAPQILADTQEKTITKYKVINTGHYRATAYNSEVAQTDSTPCITASGFDLCENNEENVAAANFLPLGTKIRIPEYYGDRIFTVEDRMATRFGNTVDIWFKDRQTALQFGVKRSVKIEVVEEIKTTNKELALNN